jgi:hypothetical protein
MYKDEVVEFGGAKGSSDGSWVKLMAPAYFESADLREEYRI